MFTSNDIGSDYMQYDAWEDVVASMVIKSTFYSVGLAGLCGHHILPNTFIIETADDMHFSTDIIPRSFFILLNQHEDMVGWQLRILSISCDNVIRKSKDYVYGIWVYKALGIWKGYYRVKKSLVSYMKPCTEAMLPYVVDNWIMRIKECKH